jgi:hypothetical protein
MGLRSPWGSWTAQIGGAASFASDELRHDAMRLIAAGPVRGGRAVVRRVDRLVTAGIPVVAEAVLSRLDLTDIVVRHVDIDQVVKTVDLDAAVNQVDLLGVAQYVIDGVNLPAIVRSSTASFTTEAVHGLRVHGVEADQAVARVVGHLIPRRRSTSS